ncbi:MAG: hypothetical protein HZB26_26775 [Candidatus Hydrogenedentes bacterium]|nr:hypothetical protein [Candidatus Hydrogenedentota bacterium]
MSRVKALSFLVAAGVFVSSAGFAAEVKPKAKAEQDWEKVEEPALRPYKCLWSGMKSVVYNTTKSFAQGNEKLPILGSIEAFRGLRRGSVDLVSGTYMGMAGSKPRPYNELGRPNRIIEDDPLLRNVADTAPSALLTPYPVPLFVAQKGVDRSPVAPEQYKQNLKEQKKARMEKARQRELRKHLGITEQPEGRGNLLRLAK